MYSIVGDVKERVHQTRRVYGCGDIGDEGRKDRCVHGSSQCTSRHTETHESEALMMLHIKSSMRGMTDTYHILRLLQIPL